MIEYDTDSEGNLTGLVEFWVVDKYGKLKDDGEFLFMNEWYINPKYRNNGGIAKFAQKAIDRAPLVKWGYFQRRKYNYRLRIYSKDKWLKIIKRYSKEGNYDKSSLLES